MPAATVEDVVRKGIERSRASALPWYVFAKQCFCFVPAKSRWIGRELRHSFKVVGVELADPERQRAKYCVGQVEAAHR